MSVRLKFYVQSKTEQSSGPGAEKLGSATLFPVNSGSDENKAFYKYTPSGKLEFGTINQAALDSLPLGAEVYITIEVAAPTNA